MELTERLILLALGTWQTVEIIHHSELLFPLKKALSYWDGRDGPLRFLWDLISCPFCLSHWVAMIFMVGICLPGVGPVVMGWLFILSAVRLANLGNDLTWNYNRTPRYEGEENGNTKVEHQDS